MTQSCCSLGDALLPRTKGELVVALAGNPNSGKTTIFNALTGLRQKVANYPGVTVEKKTGRCELHGMGERGGGKKGGGAQVIDLPGTYSLISRAPDEQVAMEVLRGLRSDTPEPDVVVVVVDASNLQRNLYLVSQLIELGRPLVVALNMMDVAKRRGLMISAEKLEKKLGVPVVAVVGYKRRGIKQLKEAIVRARVAPMPAWELPEAMREELRGISGALPHGRSLTVAAQIAERLLVGDQASDLQELMKVEGVAKALESSGRRLAELRIDPMQADIEAHYHWIDSVAQAAVAGHHDNAVTPRLRKTDRIDAILIHKVWGLLTFVLIMAAIFVAIFWLAKPAMDAINHSIQWLGQVVTVRLPEGPVKSLLNDGIFAGVGTVVSFVPQIAMLFMFLAILEDSGYLARAAFLMDRLLARVGLHGKSFIPLLSSFACAIPGIMATRSIEDRRDRLATILITPFMSCSARLPVYMLLIGTLFGAYGWWFQAVVMLLCYALGVLAAVATAWVFKRSLLKGGATTFILELPSYKVPQVSQVAREVWSNAWEFLTKAGTTILAFCVVLWALAYYPRLPEAQEQAIRQQVANADNAVAAAQSAYSFVGRIGHGMEPAIRPLGFDWKMGVGLIGAFAARETFVSTMGISYAVDTAEKGKMKNLSAAMQADRYADGRPVWTPLVAVSLLVWFVLAMQCISTVAIARRETGGWRWPIFMIVYMNVLAYVSSLLVYQAGTWMGFA